MTPGAGRHFRNRARSIGCRTSPSTPTSLSCWLRARRPSRPRASSSTVMLSRLGQVAPVPSLTSTCRPLSGRDVVLWPDNDEPGRKAMRAITDQLTDARSVKGVKPPPGLPKGWDLGDAILADLDPVALVGRAVPLAADRLAAPKLVSAADLVAREFGRRKWAVPGFLPGRAGHSCRPAEKRQVVARARLGNCRRQRQPCDGQRPVRSRRRANARARRYRAALTRPPQGRPSGRPGAFESRHRHDMEAR